MTVSIRARSCRGLPAVAMAPALAWLLLQAPSAHAISHAVSESAAPAAQAIELGEGLNAGPSLLPDLPSSGSGNDWPGPGMPQHGLPSVQDLNRNVNYWIRRTGPMGIDRCALSDLFRTSCD